MRILLLALALLPSLAQADSIRLKCKLRNPPEIQGTERFLTVEFRDNQAELKIADFTSPFESLNLPLDSASYSDKESDAFASWGKRSVVLSLVFMGGPWGGNLHFNEAVKTASLSFSAGEDLDLSCQ